MAKKALCIGINNFKNYPDNSLNGCINDAYDMHAILVKYMGFKDNEIVKLLDKEATKSNIIMYLKEMVEEAKKGKFDDLVFSMSSHGTQLPDTSGDELDRMDEAFCPYDLASKGKVWDKDHIISDDELHDLLIQIPENVNLEVYLDTCHSGTGLRVMEPIPDRQPRYIPPPYQEGFSDFTKEASGDDKAIKANPTILDAVGDNHILWAACRADETSADANIGGEWHGAFTYFFCRSININENRLSRQELLEKVVEDLKTNKYSQTPQLECDATSRSSKK
ncbi:MAG TPA: caspase family protein [Methanobacterium sp.]|nr:caspase family protein [Methanobacterium sp.]